MRIAAWLLLCSFMISMPQAAEAQAPCADECRAEARNLFLEGMTALRAERASEAADLLRRSLEQLPLSATAFNLALALRAADDPSGASHYLDELLANTYGELSAEERASVLFTRDQVDSEVGRLRITLRGADSAELRLSDEVTGEVTSLQPSTFTINPGPTTMRLRSPGFRDYRREVPINAGETLALDVRLELELEQEVSRPVRRSPWLWVSVALVLAGGGVALGWALADRPASDPTWGRATLGLQFGR